MDNALKRAPDIHFAEVGDEFYLTLESANVVACVNRAGFVLLENMDGFSDHLKVADALAERYRASGDEVRKAADEMCREGERIGILVPVSHGGSATGKEGPFVVDGIARDQFDPPRIERVWEGAELEGGMFVNSEGCDIHVIVPNVTQGPIKTCPPHTCTIPAGLFTQNTIIRTFDEDWRRNFEQFRRSGLVHFARRQSRGGEL